MEITIKFPDGSDLPLELDKSMTILSLRSEILTKQPLLPPTFKLVYLGKILKDDRTIETSSIASRSTISIIFKSRLIQVLIRNLGGYKYTIDIQPDCTIKKIKTGIRKKTGFLEGLQKLMFNDQVLVDERNLRDYGIEDKSVLNLMICMSQEIEILVKWEAREQNLVLFKSDKVIDLKNKLCKEFNVKTKEQVLVWQGMKIEDDKSLEFYKIESGGIVNLCVNDKVQVFVNIANRKIITLDVELSMTLSNLKLLTTQKEENIEILEITFNGILLKDAQMTLFEYEIKKHSEILIESVHSRGEDSVLSEEFSNPARPFATSCNAYRDNSDSILLP